MSDVFYFSTRAGYFSPITSNPANEVTVKRKRGTNPVAAHEGKRYTVRS